MSADALWAARLVLQQSEPATILDTAMIRAICEAYVAETRWSEFAWEHSSSVACGWAWDLGASCREEVLKEREACADFVSRCGNGCALQIRVGRP